MPKGDFVARIGAQWLLHKLTENAERPDDAAEIAAFYAKAGTVITIYNKRIRRHTYYCVLKRGFVQRMLHEDVATHVPKALREQERVLFLEMHADTIAREALRDIHAGGTLRPPKKVDKSPAGYAIRRQKAIDKKKRKGRRAPLPEE